MFKNRSLYIPYLDCLAFTKWLKSHRGQSIFENEKFQFSINSTIIINSCSIIEGFLFTMISGQIFANEHQLSPDFKKIEPRKNPIIFSKMLREYDQNLHQDSWTKCLRYFELFYNITIDRNTTIWKTIATLFKFRNVLVHGNELEFNFTENGDISSPNKKVMSLYSFLEEKKLASVEHENKNVKILSNKVADFFFTEMRIFLIETYESTAQGKLNKEAVEIFKFDINYFSEYHYRNNIFFPLKR